MSATFNDIVDIIHTTHACYDSLGLHQHVPYHVNMLLY